MKTVITSYYPVLAINILIRVPLPCKKGTLLTDDLPSEESSQGGIFLKRESEQS